MQDTSTPSPSDPDKPDSGKQEDAYPPKGQQKKLKLRRIIFEDTEINCDNVKIEEPTPEAQPYEEPEEAPVPEEFRQQTGQKEEKAKEEDSDAPPVIEIPPEIQSAATKREAPKQSVRTESRGKASQKSKKPASPLRRLAFILIPAALLAIVLIILYQIFDPFGDELASIKPQFQPEITEPAADQEALPEPETGLAVSEIPFEDENLSLQSFVSLFQKQRLVGSNSPRGLFVDSVFIPEGAPVNPELGIILSQISTDSIATVVTLQMPSGEILQFPVSPDKK